MLVRVLKPARVFTTHASRRANPASTARVAAMATTAHSPVSVRSMSSSACGKCTSVPEGAATSTAEAAASGPPTAISVFDMFSIGIGPSSSHTVGPMRAAERFATIVCSHSDVLDATTRVACKLYGSLALTGIGHGTPGAVMHGLEGHLPHTVEIDTYEQRVADIKAGELLNLGGTKFVEFDDDCLPLLRDQVLPQHSNGMEFFAFDKDGSVLMRRVYYSIGGGFFVSEEGLSSGDALAPANQGNEPVLDPVFTPPPYPFRSGSELLALCKRDGLTIPELAMHNELQWRNKEEILVSLRELWGVMDACIERGLRTSGSLPGGLNMARRAPGLVKALDKKLQKARKSAMMTHGLVYDSVSMWAIAVNEENAAGGRVVTAPTNGAAGVIPAVLKYYLEFVLPEQLEDNEHGAKLRRATDMLGVDVDPTTAAVVDFLLTAAVVGMLFKSGASISAAEVGCQGEVGVACSMAAAALTAVQDATLPQVESAAEIGMEHNLGLTCDPIGGRVAVPCIERNVMGAVKVGACGASRCRLSAVTLLCVTGNHCVAPCTSQQLCASRRRIHTDGQPRQRHCHYACNGQGHVNQLQGD